MNQNIRVPVDVDALTFFFGSTEVRMKDRRTGEIETGLDGRPQYDVRLMVVGEDDAQTQVWKVKVAGEPKGLVKGIPLKVSKLVASEYNIAGNFGISFRADSIVPLVTSAKQPVA